MKVLVTGSSGLIGSEAVEYYDRQGCQVFGIDNNADWENAHRAQLDDAAAKRDLQLVWFSTGKDDFLLGTTKATVAMLEKHGFDVVYEESAGGHTWINWREYLAKFAPRLFH